MDEKTTVVYVDGIDDCPATVILTVELVDLKLDPTLFKPFYIKDEED